MLASSLAFGATFNVTTTADLPDSNTSDNVCSTGGQGAPCSLRAAIQQSNASNNTQDTINLPAGVYTLTRTGAGEDNAVFGDLDIRRTRNVRPHHVILHCLR